MMPATPNLEILHVEQNQDGHAVTVSEAFDDFDGALTALVESDVTAADVVLTDEQALRNLVFKATGSPGIARTISVPDANQKLSVLVNGANAAVILKTVSGTGVAVAAGQTEVLYADGADVVSLASSCSAGIAPDVTVEVFTASGTWTKPSHLALAEIWVVGGGGGSGGVSNPGGGTQAESGSGGGGGDGMTGTAAAAFATGGDGGAGSGGDLNVPGEIGSRGRVIAAKGTHQTLGAVSAFGLGSSGVPSGSSNPGGNDGFGYGGGASGAISSASETVAGGTGAPGVVIIKNHIGVASP